MNKYFMVLGCSLLIFCLSICASAKRNSFVLKTPVMTIEPSGKMSCHGCSLTQDQRNELHLLVHEYWIALSKFCDLICEKDTQFKRQPFHERAHFLKQGAEKILSIIEKIENFYKRAGIPDCCQQGVITDMKTQVFDWLLKPQDDFTGLKEKRWLSLESLNGWSETD